MAASEERSSRTAERCREHPGRQAVGECDACGRPLCVVCAVPVRGRIVGVECLASVLGEPAGTETRTDRPRPQPLAAGGLAAIALASLLPWTRFGVGSAFLGGWDAVPSWSLLASAAGTAALLLYLALAGRRRGADVIASVAGVVAAAAAFLAFIHPPPFTKPWIGPVVAFLGGLVAVAGWLGRARRERRVG